tara:strand:- start:1234 stop:1425 length:192 start_codon:yes stop_codon:yes gene_type:complete
MANYTPLEIKGQVRGNASVLNQLAPDEKSVVANQSFTFPLPLYHIPQYLMSWATKAVSNQNQP